MSQKISQMYYEDIMWLFYGCCIWNLIVDWEIKQRYIPSKWYLHFLFNTTNKYIQYSAQNADH